MSLAGPGVRAVLVGTGSHVNSQLTDVPAVEATLRDLGRALVERCGLAEENLLVILDPREPKDVLVRVREAGRKADDVLLVVYVGHGLLARDSTLFFATAETSALDVAIADHQAIRYSALAAVIGDSRARLTIVVLDCCFSGRADPPTRHGYLLTSAGGEEPAWAPDGERYTAFTGAMIKFLRDGDPLSPQQLTLNHLYRYQCRVQAARQGTMPHQQSSNLSGDLVLADNPAYVPVARHDPTAPSPHLGFSPHPAKEEHSFRSHTELVPLEHDPLVVIGPPGAGKTSLPHDALLQQPRSHPNERINTDPDRPGAQRPIQLNTQDWQDSATTRRIQQLGVFLAAGARQGRPGQLVRRGSLALLVVLTLAAMGTAELDRHHGHAVERHHRHASRHDDSRFGQGPCRSAEPGWQHPRGRTPAGQCVQPR
jgi:hypothetical protein